MQITTEPHSAVNYAHVCRSIRQYRNCWRLRLNHSLQLRLLINISLLAIFYLNAIRDFMSAFHWTGLGPRTYRSSDLPCDDMHSANYAVRLSVPLSRSGIVSGRLNVSSHFIHFHFFHRLVDLSY